MKLIIHNNNKTTLKKHHIMIIFEQILLFVLIFFSHILILFNLSVVLKIPQPACNFVKNRDSGTGVSLRILRNFWDCFFYRTPLDGCFWLFSHEISCNYNSYKFSYKFSFIRFSFVKTKSKGQVFRFCLSQVVLHFKSMSNSINFYKVIFSHVITVRIIVSLTFFSVCSWQANFNFSKIWRTCFAKSSQRVY